VHTWLVNGPAPVTLRPAVVYGVGFERFTGIGAFGSLVLCPLAVLTTLSSPFILGAAMLSFAVGAIRAVSVMRNIGLALEAENDDVVLVIGRRQQTRVPLHTIKRVRSKHNGQSPAFFLDTAAGGLRVDGFERLTVKRDLRRVAREWGMDVDVSVFGGSYSGWSMIAADD
jgi:hypothetical protein